MVWALEWAVANDRGRAGFTTGTVKEEEERASGEGGPRNRKRLAWPSIVPIPTYYYYY